MVSVAYPQTPWKILISDDEDEVHNITRLVLENFEFEERGVAILSAYSGETTKNLIQAHPDIAIILLDVVMETDDAGLDVVRYIREELENRFVRIILRTGQPGKAPERTVITRYDINDYKEKTELTAQKLFTTVTASLRAFRDLRIIEKNRKGLELIINSSGQLYASQRIRTFSEGVLNQLVSLLELDDTSAVQEASGFAVSVTANRFQIIAATGTFKTTVNHIAHDCVSAEILGLLEQAMHKKASLFVGDAFIGYFQKADTSVNLLYLNGCANLNNLDRDLFRIFSTNVGVAFDNISLSQEIIDTQKEIIETLGGIIETRSKETANHVLRVSEYSYLLAMKAGLSEKEASLLRLSVPMHDVGKIGIPDVILNKPGALLPDEYEIIKRHTTIGHDILNKSKRRILQAAAIVAIQHHEYWDGTGYPNGLKGEEIHIYGRITGLVDVYDAVSCKRAYKEEWTVDRVCELIRKQKGRQFDPMLVDIFLDAIDEFEKIKEIYTDEYL
ncbi:DUF3369 domain-containing protein [bacterium]|nr:DUF3369 domain-containing protein [bacterium]